MSAISDGTIRVMKDNFNIQDGYIWFFPPLISDCFCRSEKLRRASLFQRWKLPTISKFFRWVSILYCCKCPTFSKFSDAITFPIDRISDSFYPTDYLWSVRQPNVYITFDLMYIYIFLLSTINMERFTLLACSGFHCLMNGTVHTYFCLYTPCTPVSGTSFLHLNHMYCTVGSW